MLRRNDKSPWIPVPPPALAVVDYSRWRRVQRERRYWQILGASGFAALERARQSARR